MATTNKSNAKVVLLGGNNCGKSWLLERYIHDRFNQNISLTIGPSFEEKREVINDKSLKLQIWDTPGVERFDSTTILICRGAMAAIICYDLTDSSSFDKAKFWVNELRTNEENCEIFLCGTKFDLINEAKVSRKVDYHTTKDYADEIHAKVFETSSLTGENVGELFCNVAKTCLEKLPVAKDPKEIPSIALTEPKKQKRRPCN